MTSLINKIGLTTLLLCASHSAAAFVFTDFSNTTNLVLNANAAKYRKVLRLTPANVTQVGSVFNKTAVNATKFSSFFSFKITKRGGAGGGDGFAFIIQALSADTVGYSGGDLGYKPIANSIAIEFDTYKNDEYHDPNANHIALDINGSVNHDNKTLVKRVSPSLSNGKIWYVWLDYNGTKLEVRLNQTNSRPLKPKLSTKIDIPNILTNNTAYVGFSAGTGGAWENHDILSWEYREAYQPIGTSNLSAKLQTSAISCENLTTKQIVDIPLSKVNTWNCEQAGFIAHQGDNTVITIKGKVK